MSSMNLKCSFFLFYIFLICFSFGDKIQLELRDRVKESDDFIVRLRDQEWDPNNTAVLIQCCVCVCVQYTVKRTIARKRNLLVEKN